MLELSLSIKGVADVVSSAAKAFDDLYSTLRKVATDGWNGAEYVFRALNNNQDERRAKRCVILMRKLQIQKIAASVALSYNSDVDRIHDSLWEKIEDELKKILLEIGDLNALFEGGDSFIISSALQVQYPEFVRGMFVRQQLIVNFLERRSQASSEEVRQQVSKLTEVLDLEAKLIGQCADLLTEFITSSRLLKNSEKGR
jgi:hypothetical protein